MILLDIYRPNPVPTIDFVANFVNRLGIISGSIPCQCRHTDRDLLIDLSSLVILTDIFPFEVNLIALLKDSK